MVQNGVATESQLMSVKIYWVGPILGSLLASGFYVFIKLLEYESANPGQDFDGRENPHVDRVDGHGRSESEVAFNPGHNTRP